MYFRIDLDLRFPWITYDTAMLETPNSLEICTPVIPFSTSKALILLPGNGSIFFTSFRLTLNKYKHN